jgi:hypothetical protein
MKYGWCNGQERKKNPCERATHLSREKFISAAVLGQLRFCQFESGAIFIAQNCIYHVLRERLCDRAIATVSMFVHEVRTLCEETFGQHKGCCDTRVIV